MKIEQFDQAKEILDNLRMVNYYISLIKSDGIDIGSCNKHIPMPLKVDDAIKQIVLDELHFQKITLENNLEKI